MPSLADSIQNTLGLPVLSEIPLTQAGGIPSPPDEPFLEGVRFLRAGLQWQRLPPPTLAVVPSEHSNVTMMVARYLARSFAESGRDTSLILAIEPADLGPLPPLPGGAALPPETFLSPAEIDQQIRQQARDALTIVYCPPMVAALNAIAAVETAVLLVEESFTVEDVQRTMAACDTAITPAIAAAVLRRHRPSRIPAPLRRWLPRRIFPSA